MFAKAIALPAILALAQQVQADVWTTVYETHYVTKGVNPPAATAAPVVVVPPPQTTLVTLVRPAPQENAEEAGDSDEAADAAPTQNANLAADAATFAKRGIAYNDVTLANTMAQDCPNCGWTYNWDSASAGVAKRLNYIPMLWSDRADHVQNWNANANAAIKAGSTAIFSFNEPDNQGQAAMSPDYAAKKHIQYMNPFKGKALIGAPAVTNSGNPGEGIEWLKSFLSSCKAEGGCTVDFCNVHWYSGAQYSETLFTHLDAAHKACGNKPIWLTEFAPTGASDTDTVTFLNKVLPRLEKLTYLHAYAYFMTKKGSLMNNQGSLSTYGKTYATHAKGA